MLLNSRLAHDDPEPWMIHYGLDFGEERFADQVNGAQFRPRKFPTPCPSTALVKFRKSTRLLGVGAYYNAVSWLSFMQGFPGHLEQGMDPDELTHLRAVLQRLVNVYGEA